MTSYNRRKTNKHKPVVQPTGPTKERSCGTCRRRKVRCDESRPSCSNCVKAALNSGQQVCCVYSQRSIFYSEAASPSPSPTAGCEGSDQPNAGHQLVGGGGEQAQGRENVASEADDDARSMTSSHASPFEHVNTPSTTGTTPPASPSLQCSAVSDQVVDDGLVDYDAEGETDDEDLFESRPILASSFLAAPPSTPFAATFPTASFSTVGVHPPKFQPPPNPVPLLRAVYPIPQALQSIPSNALSGLSPAQPPRLCTAPSLGVRLVPPQPTPALRADGTLTMQAGSVGFWDEGPLSREEIMTWGSLQQSVWFARG